MSVTVKPQSLEQQQSLELVHGLLYTAVGTLTFLRALLPQNCYEDRHYSASSTDSKGKEKGTKVKHVRHGSGREADCLLNWLENGVFDAIGKQYLDAMQLAIFGDPQSPELVLEVYTFNFQYGSSTSLLEGVSLSTSSGSSTKVSDLRYSSARRSIQLMMRRLILITQDLPPLPDRRYLTIRLYYTDTSPVDYQAPGFCDGLSEDLMFAENDEHGVERNNFGHMSSGLHAVSIRLSALRNRSEKTTNEAVLQTRRLLEISSTSSALEDIRSVLDEAGSRFSGFSSSAAGPKARSPVPRPPADAGTLIQDSGVSFARIGTLEKRTLANMARTVPSAQPDISTQMNAQMTQLPGSYELREPPMTEIDSFNRLSIGQAPERQQIHETIGADETVSKLITKWKTGKLSQAKRVALERSQIAEPGHVGVANDAAAGGDLIACQCGSEEEGGEGLLQCDFCHKWQHAHCYGFVDADDPSIPEIHACYGCLLGPSESAILRELQTIALVRRALTKCENSGYPHSIKAFAEQLGCDLPTAKMITDKLLYEGYLQAPRTSVRQRGSQRNAPKYAFVRTRELLQKKRATYFDPFAFIGHHYEMSSARVSPVSSSRKEIVSETVPTATEKPAPASAYETTKQSETHAASVSPMIAEVRPEQEPTAPMRRSTRTPSKPQRFASETHAGSVGPLVRKRFSAPSTPSNQTRKRRRGDPKEVVECSFMED